MMMTKYVIVFDGEDMVTLYTPHNDWQTTFSILVTQVEEVRNKVQRLEVIETEQTCPSDMLPMEWQRLEYDGKKIIVDYDLRIIHNEFEEGNVYHGK